MALLSIEEIVLELAEKELGKTYEPVYTKKSRYVGGQLLHKQVLSGYKLVSEIKECTSCHDYTQHDCLVCKGTRKYKVTYRELEEE